MHIGEQLALGGTRVTAQQDVDVSPLMGARGRRGQGAGGRILIATTLG